MPWDNHNQVRVSIKKRLLNRGNGTNPVHTITDVTASANGTTNTKLFDDIISLVQQNGYQLKIAA